jgi:hypothetical protein
MGDERERERAEMVGGEEKRERERQKRGGGGMEEERAAMTTCVAGPIQKPTNNNVTNPREV